MFGSWYGGVGWGGVGVMTFLGTCIWFVLWSETFADVANVRMFIFLFAKLAHALGATLTFGLCCGGTICCYACRCC